MAISMVSFSFSWCSTGWPGGSAFCWVLAFSTTSCLQLSGRQLSDFLSPPSYIIVNHPGNFWNGIFDRLQAEITVMQLRDHSLPVHQSMSVSWAFTLSHFVSQIRLRDLFRLLAIGMCHFLPVNHFGMACLAWSIYNITCKSLSEIRFFHSIQHGQVTVSKDFKIS